MIELIGGLHGGGKSHEAVRRGVNVVAFTRKLIVTNMEELELGWWQKTLEHKLKDKGGFQEDISRRVFIIPRPDTSEYYRFRGLATHEPFEVRRGEDIKGQDIRLEAYFKRCDVPENPGVFYLMDELHRHFRSERWDEISPAIMFHLAQHRHLDDDFLGISQNPEQVAARFLRQVAEFHYMRNHYRESFGIFKKPGCLYRRSFYYVPKTGDRNAVPFEESKLKIDKEWVGRCYRTRGALGGANLGAETQRKSRKLAWWTIIPAAAVGAVVVMALIIKTPDMFVAGIKKLVGAGAKAGQALAEPPGNKVLGSRAEKSAAGQKNAELSSVKGEATRVQTVLWSPGLWVTGVSHNNTHWNVQLSDGRVLTEQGGEVKAVGRGFVDLRDGTRVYMVKPQPKAVPPPLPRDESKGGPGTPPATESPPEVQKPPETPSKSGFDDMMALGNGVRSVPPAVKPPKNNPNHLPR